MGGIEVEETLQSGPRLDEGTQRFGIGVTAAGRYRIARFIAAGGMGEVYAARDLILDSTVALKTLRPELQGSRDAIERLRREIALARNVTNQHVCRVHDVGEHEGYVFLTMELLEGRTLSERAASAPLSIDEIERIAKQLVDGLAALHHAKIIHRDFKTSNIMLVGEGASARVVITDFGLARSVDPKDARITLEASLLGTPAYMAPEQVEARTASEASDIYAFGVVMFELLTRRLPFHEDTVMATMTARLVREAPRPSSYVKTVPPRWDAIVARCLARDPAERFARIEDVLGPTPTRVSRRWFLAAGGGAAAIAGLGLWRVTRSSTPEVPALSTATDVLAVLPVAAATAGSDVLDDPLRLALTLDIHDALATTTLPVMSIFHGGMNLGLEGAAMHLARTPDPATAAFALPGVAVLVQLVLARAGDRLDLDVGVLARGATGWRERLSRPLSEAALLARDVAGSIARRFGVALRPSPETARLQPVYAQYGEALVGMYSPNSKVQPRRRLLEELAGSAKLARAAALIAERMQGNAEQQERYEDASPILEQASKLVDQALAADPDCALAYAIRGHIAMLRWDWKRADENTRRGVELAPGHQRVGYHRNFFLMLTGRFAEGVPHAERMHRRNPKPRIGEASLSWHYYYARRFDDVVRVTEPMIERFDMHDWIESVQASMLVLAYAELARFDDALELAERLRKGGSDDYTMSSLLGVYSAAGRPDLAKLVADQSRDKIGIGGNLLMYDALGDREAALAAATQIVESHNVHAMFLKIERVSPQLRGDPRFQALLAKVGFP